ncbi:hypothetical protein F511_40994 [Dorcoceras hygrometricum]|uniref:Uncharacterized protein n=1 Tax=Dorcoceras hygrometricum TaxID=472368 RepID=A0A2Z7CA69_9LAMI|nr:hypothetical protein F511_40994 [Dorcoceras hygrometricum]
MTCATMRAIVRPAASLRLDQRCPSSTISCGQRSTNDAAAARSSAPNGRRRSFNRAASMAHNKPGGRYILAQPVRKGGAQRCAIIARGSAHRSAIHARPTGSCRHYHTRNRRPSPLSSRRRRRRVRRRLLHRKIVSGQFDEENPFVQISSVLLVQADEGVSFLVVDRIGDFYRNLPRRADVIVTTVGARHKCQQGDRPSRLNIDGSILTRDSKRRHIIGPLLDVRFIGLNYQDWLRNLNLVLASEKLLYTIEKSPPEEGGGGGGGGAHGGGGGGLREERGGSF